MNKYSKEIIRSEILSSKKTIFLGQSVIFPGNLLYKTLSPIKKNKIELPVFGKFKWE